MIKVIDKAFNIVEHLASDPYKVFSLADIADEFGMDHGTCANILKTMALRGYVQKSGPRQGYKLGYKFYDLSGVPVSNDELTALAQPFVNELAEKINESVILSSIKNDKRVVLFHTVPQQEIVVKTNIEKNIYATNTGRVILAHYSPEKLSRIIGRIGLPAKEDWPEVFTSGRLDSQMINRLTEIRLAGYEIYRSKNIEGVAAPLFRDGKVVGSIGVYLPLFRMKDEKFIIDSVLDSARRFNSIYSAKDTAQNK